MLKNTDLKEAIDEGNFFRERSGSLMLTKITIRRFKRFRDVEIELGNPVVFIGPNNSGKTTALQALALWDLGLRKWNEKRKGKSIPEKRPGVTINRRDLSALPVPSANHLWRNLHVRDVRRGKGKQRTRNVRVDIIVEGFSNGSQWRCGLEFDYANEESFYCRPLRLEEKNKPDRMTIPGEAATVQMAFLPPMSGLAANETRLDPGAINVRIGEARTAEVLRNLCYQVSENLQQPHLWDDLRRSMEDLFGITLDRPKYISERGELVLTYRESAGPRLDISASGRGLQQTLLIMAHLAGHPHSVLLLDEPDAHLEILRQRQIYQILSDFARKNGSQIIAASHSEVFLNEAAKRDVVVAFVGRPHRIDDRGSQVRKSLKQISFDHYYQAEQTGWVLYLEGSTDLAILRVFAQTLEHPARDALERPFVQYVFNSPQKARDHFYGLREAKGDLVGFALFDRLSQELPDSIGLRQRIWSRREIESYCCTKDVLLAWAEATGADRVGPLFASHWRAEMEDCITIVEGAMETLGQGSPWGPDVKVSDKFLDPLFDKFFSKLELPNLMRKTNYHVLVSFLPKDQIDPEVLSVLDDIVSVATSAKPVQDE